VVKNSYNVFWSSIAIEQFEEILEFIYEESPVGAKIVKESILERINQLAGFPLMYEPDVLCDDNDGSYRAFAVFSYRITYLISDGEIIILRVRHTSREPEGYS
jgi:plasmid stabilization system protein ParE